MHAERVQNPMGYEYYGNALSTALLLKYVPQKPFSLYMYIKKRLYRNSDQKYSSISSLHLCIKRPSTFSDRPEYLARFSVFITQNSAPKNGKHCATNNSQSSKELFSEQLKKGLL